MNKFCKHCNKIISEKLPHYKTRLFCSNECRLCFNSARKHYKICPICESKFYVTPHDLKRRKYCSLNCKYSSQKGMVFSKETLLKMGKSQKGRKHSEETKKKMSLWQIGKKLSLSTRNKISLAHKGKKLSEEHKQKISEFFKGNTYSRGIKHTEEARRNMSQSQIRRVKEGKNHMYKDGMSKFRKKCRRYAMGLIDYKLWREMVFKRDKYKCQDCGKKHTIVAHHKAFWIDYPERRFSVGNGITLCPNCHKNYH